MNSKRSNCQDKVNITIPGITGDSILVTNVTAGKVLITELAIKITIMDSAGMIIFGIVMLHLVAGFGYVVYKLNTKQKPGK